MLSGKLETLTDHLRSYRATGVVLEPAAVTAIVAILDASTADAKRLEGAPVPAARRGELPEGVVDLTAVLAQQRPRSSPPGDGGGEAA